MILKQLTGQSMQQHIKKSVRKDIPTSFQSECIQVINEDIAHMGPERIYGLGISQKELRAWQKIKS